MVRSRLKKKLERRGIKDLFLSLLGIIIVITLLVKFGIPLLVNFSLFLSGSNTRQESNVNNKDLYLPAPIINTQEIATNSAQIQIKGSSLPNQTIILYVNGGLADKIQTNSNGNFSSIITLASGKNIIRYFRI